MNFDSKTRDDGNDDDDDDDGCGSGLAHSMELSKEREGERERLLEFPFETHLDRVTPLSLRTD